MSGGWLRGAACVREKTSPEYVNRVLLLTDGQANHGIVDPAILVKHAAELTEEGIATTTLGYGDDFNDDLLTALADAGRGSAYHVETADQAPTIFAQELEGLLAIAAQNVRITFTPSSLVRRVDLCSAVENHQDGKTLTVTMGDLVSADTRPLLVTVRTNAAAHEGWVSLGTITVTYDDVVGGIQPKVLTRDLLLGALASAKVAAIPADAAVVKERLILRAAKVLQTAIAQADGGDVKGAMQRLETLHDLQDRGFNTVNRKQMLYCSRGWSGGRGGSAA
jgi:Ca-activated chloride channel family protein